MCGIETWLNKGRCEFCYRRSSNTTHNYLCEASDGGEALIPTDQIENYLDSCPNGFPYRNLHNPNLRDLPERDGDGRPLFLDGQCDVCIEWQDQERFELQEYRDEPAAAPIQQVPDHHPMRPPNQVALIRTWDTFGGPNPGDQLRFYRYNGAIEYRRYTGDEWDAMQQDAALLEDRDEYHSDQHSFSPSGYFNYLRRHPRHQSNMREHMEVHDQMIDEVRDYLEQQRRQQEEQPDLEEEDLKEDDVDGDDLDEDDLGEDEGQGRIVGELTDLDEQMYQTILHRDGLEAAREWWDARFG